MTPQDLCALGAATLPSRELVRLLVRRPMSDDELDTAVRALALAGPPREAACRSLRCGPQLLAAIELGRRAWMLPSPAGRRMRGPVDVVATIAPRMVDDENTRRWVIVVDSRLTVVRIEPTTHDDPGATLGAVLSARATRCIVIARCFGPATIEPQDQSCFDMLFQGARLVGVHILDLVVLGDNGFCSAKRLGMLPLSMTPEPRYQ